MILVKLHFVHWNQDKFSSFEEAASEDKGLSVLAVFLDVDNQENHHPEFEKITSLLSEIKYKGQSVPIKQELMLEQLLPSGKN